MKMPASIGQPFFISILLPTFTDNMIAMIPKILRRYASRDGGVVKDLMRNLDVTGILNARNAEKRKTR
jgi:hypothetical protein